MLHINFHIAVQVSMVSVALMACSINESEIEQGEAGKSDTSHFKFNSKVRKKNLKLARLSLAQYIYYQSYFIGE